MKISLYFLYKYTFLLRPKNVHIKGELELLFKESQFPFFALPVYCNILTIIGVALPFRVILLSLAHHLIVFDMAIDHILVQNIENLLVHMFVCRKIEAKALVNIATVFLAILLSHQTLIEYF